MRKEVVCVCVCVVNAVVEVLKGSQAGLYMVSKDSKLLSVIGTSSILVVRVFSYRKARLVGKDESHQGYIFSVSACEYWV